MEQTKEEVKAEAKEVRHTTLRIRELMQQAGINMTELATRCDMHAANLTGFIKGARNPTLETLDRLAVALGVPTWQMIISPDDVLRELQGDKDEAPDAAQQGDAGAAPQQAAEAPQKPADGLDYDLLTIDPITGKSRRYKLLND